MTNNTDDLYPLDDGEDGFDPTERGNRQAGGTNLKELWNSSPMIKLFALMAGVVVLVLAVYTIGGGSDEKNISRMQATPDAAPPPGGAVSPQMDKALQEHDSQRINNAMLEGGSALPTPRGETKDVGNLDGSVDVTTPEDPTLAWQKALEQQGQNTDMTNMATAPLDQLPTAPPPPAQPPAPDPRIGEMAGKMAQQMEGLMEGWVPKTATVTVFAGSEATINSNSSTQTAANSSVNPALTGAGNGGGTVDGAVAPIADTTSQSPPASILVPAGTVYYGQLLTEANSDVPGAILATIVGGPFAGGRLVGQFRTERNHLVLNFTKMVLDDQEFSANILALDPNTTLGGLATEVDGRYMVRYGIPAAVAFLQGFAEAVTQVEQTVTITGDSVVASQPNLTRKEEIYSGIRDGADVLLQGAEDETSEIKRLVRVAAGTPLGLFFVDSVVEGGQ